MCGIYASISNQPHRTQERYCPVHRGPDDFGTLNLWEGRVQLKHWRLSILDLTSGGHQPMKSQNARYSIIFNGEIYNYIELRETLRAKGFEFFSASDTEVLLKVFEVYGLAGVDQLNGIFALVIWDSIEKMIFAIRDRFGVKPLYWKYENGLLEIGSEIKQLTSLTNKANLDKCVDFLESGTTDHSAETLFAGIYQLRGGSYFIASQSENFRPVVNKWHTDELKESNGDFEDIFERAIKLQLRSDVPVGTCLSGGLDSSSIAVAMKKIQPDVELNTFTAIFPGSNIDESEIARKTADKLHAIHHEVRVSPQKVMRAIEEQAWIHDEPTGSSSMLAQYEVMKTASEAGMKVMLDGQGADEIFGGYSSTFDYFQKENFKIPGKIHQANRQLIQKIAHLRKTPSASGTITNPDWLLPEFKKRNSGAHSAWQNGLLANEIDEPNSVREFLVFMTYVASLPMLLHSEDRNSMANGIEARVPFLDNELANFALNLPTTSRMTSKFSKIPIRRYLEGKVSPSIYLNKRKLGFATPEKEWFQTILRQDLEKMYQEAAQTNRDIVNVDVAVWNLNQKLANQQNWDFTVWRLLSFNAWRKRFNVNF